MSPNIRLFSSAKSIMLKSCLGHSATQYHTEHTACMTMKKFIQNYAVDYKLSRLIKQAIITPV